MSVYVDDMCAGYGRMKMCHMLADSHEELIAAAKAVGVGTYWIQKPGTYQEHFDICLRVRADAVKKGAIEIDTRQLGLMLRERRALAGEREPESGG